MDSIVLACVLISYCPFLMETHFEQFYTHPSTPEQCSHNAILIINALKYIGIDYDIQPSDLCSSNPISMILLVIHLYERMFAFKPKKTLTFETVLGESVLQQVNSSIYVPADAGKLYINIVATCEQHYEETNGISHIDPRRRCSRFSPKQQ